MNGLDGTLLTASLLIVLGVPLLIVSLNELIDRLKRRNSSFVKLLQQIRDVVLPLAAMLYVLRYVFQVSDQDTPAALVSTIFWISLIVVIYRMMRGVIDSAEARPNAWQTRVPDIFLKLPPYVAIAVIAIHIVQNVWALPLSEMATTLGLGSVVVAFALQDTLSNLVSGLLLLANSPFRQGEWIHVGELEGRVVDINWRYTSIETRNGDMVVIPNGSIAQESIENHNRPTPNSRITQAIDVAFSNPPNRVKEMLVDTMLATPGILATPAPTVAVTRIDDPLMGYEVRYWIKSFDERETIHDQFMTRVWYATKRYDIALPSPAFDLYNYDAAVVNQESEITAEVRTRMLSGLGSFDMLPRDALAQLGEASELLHFATDEYALRLGETSRGFFVVISGVADLMLPQHDAEAQLVKRLDAGGFFGEAGLFGKAVSDIDAHIGRDAELLLIAYEAINAVINRHPQFSAEMNALIMERRVTIERIQGSEVKPLSGSQLFGRNGNGGGVYD